MCVSDEADSPERFSLLLFLDKWNHISPCFSPDCRFLSLLSSGGFFFVCFFLPDKILRFALKEPFYRVNVVLRPSCSFVENQFIINVKVNVFCWSKRSRNGGFTLTFIFYYLKYFFGRGKKKKKLCASFWLKCSGLNGKITKLCLIFRCKSWMTHFFWSFLAAAWWDLSAGQRSNTQTNAHFRFTDVFTCLSDACFRHFHDISNDVFWPEIAHKNTK